VSAVPAHSIKPRKNTKDEELRDLTAAVGNQYNPLKHTILDSLPLYGRLPKIKHLLSAPQAPRERTQRTRTDRVVFAITALIPGRQPKKQNPASKEYNLAGRDGWD
jgi:hypothetical protein